MEKKLPFGGLSAAGLRNLALLLMLLDHMYHTVASGQLWLNCVGRLAFPIFAFQIAEGFRRSSNLKRYKLRLLIFALLSEIPFNMMLGSWIYPFHQNVLFTMLLGLVAIEGVEKGRACQKLLKSWLYAVGVPLLCLLAATVFMVDYGWVGVATILVFQLFYEKKLIQLVLLVYLNQFCLGGRAFPLFGGAFYLQMQALAVLALGFIWLYNGKKGRGPNLGYWFYPLHMLVLVGLAYLIR